MQVWSKSPFLSLASNCAMPHRNFQNTFKATFCEISQDFIQGPLCYLALKAEIFFGYYSRMSTLYSCGSAGDKIGRKQVMGLLLDLLHSQACLLNIQRKILFNHSSGLSRAGNLARAND